MSHRTGLGHGRALTLAGIIFIAACGGDRWRDEVRFGGRDAEHWGRLLASGSPEARAALIAGGVDAAPMLIALAGSDDPGVTNEALAMVSLNPEALSLALPGCLTSKDSSRRACGLVVAAALGESARPALAAVMACLDDESDEVRRESARALGLICSPMDEPANRALQAAVRNGDGLVSVYAARSLGRIGSSTDAVLATLVSGLDSRDDRIAAASARALGDLGAAAARTVPDLMAALDHDQQVVRFAAAQALGKMGAAAAPAIPALEAATGDAPARGLSGDGRNTLTPASIAIMRIRQACDAAGITGEPSRK